MVKTGFQTTSSDASSIDHSLSTGSVDKTQPFNKYSQQSAVNVIKSILGAGLYPNVAATEDGIAGGALGKNLQQVTSTATKGNPLWYDGRRQVHIHPSSINNSSKVYHYPFLVYLEKTGLVSKDGWLKLLAPAQIAVLFKELRSTLHSVLEDLFRKPEISAVIEKKLSDPSFIYF